MNKKTSNLFFCRFPPPHTGETIASKQVVETLKDDIPIKEFNVIRRPRKSRLGGKFRYSELIDSFENIIEVKNYIKQHSINCFYFVPSSSLLGHVRDYFLIRSIRPFVNKIIAHVHSGNFQKIFIIPIVSKYISENVDTYIFLADYLKSTAKHVIAPYKSIVIPNAIDSDMHATDREVANKQSLKAKRSVLHVSFISNMYETKGYKDIALALSFLIGKIKFKINFIGSWPDKKTRLNFEHLCKEIGIEKHVTIHGVINDRALLKNHYLETDVFVLPTYYSVEAQPLSIIEALNTGTPVISTRHASIPEYIFDEKNGCLVDKHAPKQIANALLKLSNYEYWLHLSKGARESYLHFFLQEKIKVSLLNVFKNKN